MQVAQNGSLVPAGKCFAHVFPCVRCLLSKQGSQGINRLGKGSAKPGTLRPTDPNRFKTEDFFSVDAEDDPEYLRRVMEVEQLAVNKTGAVLSKGAFDKNDALYLKDEADKARHDELERRDAELAQFARVKSKADTSAAMEPFDPGPAIKRPKLVKSKVAVKKACQPASSTGASARDLPGSTQHGKHESQPDSQPSEVVLGVLPVTAGPLRGQNVSQKDSTTAGLGLQYESSSEDDSDGSRQ